MMLAFESIDRDPEVVMTCARFVSTRLFSSDTHILVGFLHTARVRYNFVLIPALKRSHVQTFEQT
jgi:hypothetical protein